MTNYTEDDASVRVDFFKPTGKWYTTEAIKWVDYTGDIREAFIESLRLSLGNRLSGMTAVCLNPYHKFAHPLMVVYEG